MFKPFKSLLALALLAASTLALAKTVTSESTAQAPEVLMKTTHGNMVIRLNPDRAPETVKNFLAYVNSGFYKDTVFHRVIPRFMIQGGGFTSDMDQKATLKPIRNESANGLSNRRGTIAMARTSNPDSATSQFFINVVNNDFLNYQAGRPGYAVFGEVVDGMEVMDSIAAVKTGSRGPYSDVPVDTVTILGVEEIPAEKESAENTVVKK